jgi:vitamin B12 transporter
MNIERTNWSVFMQNRLELYQRAFITTGVRREQNGQFGAFTTGRADISLLIPESDTRIHGAVGNAFRAPSFYECFSAFGNPGLQPEKNFAYDAGVEQHFWKKRITLGATWFNNDFKDLVSFGYNTNRMENLNRANTRGFELAAEIRPIKQIILRGTGTLMHTEDDAGLHLLRRPGKTYTAQFIVRPVGGLDLSLDLLHIGARADLGPAAENLYGRVRNDGYTRVDAATSYSFLKHWRAFGRVENLLDRHYEDVKTFPAPGRNVLAGMEFSWRF